MFFLTLTIDCIFLQICCVKYLDVTYGVGKEISRYHLKEEGGNFDREVEFS